MRPILVSVTAYLREPATRGIVATLVVLAAILTTYAVTEHRRIETAGPLTSVVVLTRTGGMAGVHDTVTVWPGGTYLVAQGHRVPVLGILDEHQLRRLAVALDRADLRRRSIPDRDDPCCDLFSYTLSYDGRDYPVSGDVPRGVGDAYLVLDPLLDAPSLP